MPNLAVLVAIALASFRLTRLVTDDVITKPFRQWLDAFAWDSENRYDGGDGFTYPTARAPWRTWLHGLLTCGWCLGVWVSAATYVLWDHGGGVGRTIVAVGAVAGVQGLAAHVSSLGVDDE